ncbi:uncharacterized protein LOC118738933 [Rhagoletis pomonella]|uniref:uncharacterized protein LOC118738933 n=1 Tax=Rhagoletis pomonella TaxID=28610 RepID=UPI001785F04B|nr:uncharacterized protein LOC118738933 [Rhagoletis pomonella]
MKFNKISFISVLIVLLAISAANAKRHKKHRSSASSNSPSSKTKTKTKWSSSSDLGRSGGQLATEEHGYYVKRTFLPLNDSAASYPISTLRSPPYLGIPIAWYACEGEACTKANTAAISGSAIALQDGFLCDDDCVEPYDPICGKTPSELAVFYNKCKLNVAKCRTHGLWLDVPFEECKQTNPKEVAYAARKFKRSPFFREIKTVNEKVKKPEDGKSKEDDSSEEDAMLDVALQTLDKIGDQIAEAEAEALDEASTAAPVKSEVNSPIATKPVQAAEDVYVGKPEDEGNPIATPAKEISAADKLVKAHDATKAEENSVLKPVESNQSKPAGGSIFQQVRSHTHRLAVKK